MGGIKRVCLKYICGEGDGDSCTGVLLMVVFSGELEFEAALVEMVIRHRNRQSSGEPDGELAVFFLTEKKFGLLRVY